MTARFARHELIPGWSQDRLASATAVVMGVGALGNECARLLAMAGLGRIILCDPDRIEETNLSRTTLFRDCDIGRLKVDAAAETLGTLAPGITIDVRAKPLASGVGLAELRDSSIILGCLDSRSSRLQLAGRCRLVGAPSIDGGTHPWGGEIRPYLDPKGPCYGCSLTEAQRSESDVPWSCVGAASLGGVEAAAAPFSAVVAAWMSGIAVRFLMGLPCPQGFLSVDGSRGTTTVVRQERDLTCPLHVPIGLAQPVAVGSGGRVGDLLAALGKGEVPVVWERVQQAVECPRCGFAEVRWAAPAAADCTRCGHALRPRTTIDLHGAPLDLRLRDLGVAPREILYVRGGVCDRWVELNG